QPPPLSTHTPPTTTPTLSLHDALPISGPRAAGLRALPISGACAACVRAFGPRVELTALERAPQSEGSRALDAHACLASDELGGRSEEHTSELQSLRHFVCRLLLEKKNR